MKNDGGLNNLCKDTFYYCRCVVTRSTRLQWIVDGNLESRIFPTSTTSSSFLDPNEPLNILIQKVDLGDNEAETNYTSVLWFYSNHYNESNLSVTCESDLSSSTQEFKRPGIYYTDTPD